MPGACPRKCKRRPRRSRSHRMPRVNAGEAAVVEGTMARMAVASTKAAAAAATTTAGEDARQPRAFVEGKVACHMRPQHVIELRPCVASDAAFIFALTEVTMRKHVEATWGAWDPERVTGESAA